jgi:lipopolysaccharide transport system permease protein
VAAHTTTEALELPTRGAPAGGRRLAAIEAAGAVTVTDTPPGVWTLVREAWRERRLAPQLGTRVLLKLIWGTKLGAWWLVLRPTMDTLGKALIFGALLGVAAPGGVPYFVYLLAGLIGWRLFDRIVLYATRSFDLYRKIMTQIDFPLLLAPLSSAAFPLVEVSVYVAVLLGAVLFFLILHGELYLALGFESLAALGGLAILVAAGCGIGLWTSVLHGKARDTRLVMRYVLEFWLYLTPVVYPLSAISPGYRVLFNANPLTAPVEMVKLGLLGTGEVTLYPALWSTAFAAIAVTSGLWFFSREARRSVDMHGPGADEDEDEERDEL